MINRTTSITRFVIGLLLVALIAGCAGGATQESTGEYVDDSSITASVKAAIYNDPRLKVGQISVESHKGVVQLSGFVDSRQAATRAVELARSVKGVKSVKNSLIVK
jgi:osmotically-inducible protein OsmY